MDIDIVNPEIDKYLENSLPPREPVFIEMERKADREDFPAVGPQVGKFLEIMARSIGARRIMELGSGFGYSGLWFAKALPADGYILLTDFNESNRRLAEENFKKAGVTQEMEFRVGDALELLADEKGPYDLIFNDIDKEFYPDVIEPVYRLLRKGGLFITDNALWHGRVSRPAQYPEKATAAVLEFNARLKEHAGFLTSILPLRDGISICIKL